MNVSYDNSHQRRAGGPKKANISSLASLVIANIVVIVIAIVQDWELGTLLWSYWCQSVLIGFFNVIRILSLKEFSAKGLRSNGRQLSNGIGTKLFVAFFFMIHYGIFHIVYAFFLAIFLSSGFFGEETSADGSAVALSTGVFFINHLLSLIIHRDESNAKPNIGQIMMRPYPRIIPMHMTIIFAGFFGGAQLIFFLVIKAGADIFGHINEHRKVQLN